MNCKVEKTENANEVKLEITVEAEKFENAMKKVYFQNAKYFNIPGFRKGKAPMQIVEKYYGKEIFYEDAFNEVAGEALDEAVKENKLEVVSRPDIEVEQIEKGKDLKFSAIMQTKPEAEVSKYKGIEIKKVEYNVTDEDINHELGHMQEHNSRLISIEDRPVESGDIATIDFEGFVDGKAFEGGKGENYSLELGSNTFIPGFEEQLIGLKKGEETEVNVSFPENYFSKELAGKPAVFKVKVNDIKVKELPAIDDEFAKDVSEFDTLKELKADTKKKLEEENAQRAKFEMEEEAIKAVVDATEVNIPVVMIENEINDYTKEMESRLRYQGMNLETYLQLMGQSISDFKEQYKERAEQNVKTKLTLEAVFKAENIEITDKEIEEKLKGIAERYGSTGANVEELIKNPTDDLKEYVKEELKYDLAVKFIMDNLAK